MCQDMKENEEGQEQVIGRFQEDDTFDEFYSEHLRKQTWWDLLFFFKHQFDAFAKLLLLRAIIMKVES